MLRKRLPLLGIILKTPPRLIWLSIVLELLFAQLLKYVISRLYSNKELIKCSTISLYYLKFFHFKFKAVSLAVAAASIAYSFVQ